MEDRGRWKEEQPFCGGRKTGRLFRKLGGFSKSSGKSRGSRAGGEEECGWKL